MSKNKANSGQGRRKGRRRRRSKKSDSNKAADFWGAEGASIELERHVVATADPTAVVTSLGRPPLSEHSTAAETYFEDVYHRAAALSGALAAAGDLAEPEST